MQRIINVYHPNHKNLLENYENVDISDINNIINYSTDLIRLDNIQLFDDDTSQRLLATLIVKLKHGGNLLLSLYNIKLISKLYSENILSDGNFLSLISSVKSIWSVDFISSYIEDQHKDTKITKIQYDNQNYLYNITLERTSI